MPSVMEIPEIVEEERVESSHPARPQMSAPHLGFISKLTALVANVTPRHKAYADRQGLHREENEMPLDILAREHPYMYIKAMAG